MCRHGRTHPTGPGSSVGDAAQQEPGQDRHRCSSALWHPNGVIWHPNGTIQHPNGVIWHPNGALQLRGAPQSLLHPPTSSQPPSCSPPRMPGTRPRAHPAPQKPGWLSPHSVVSIYPCPSSPPRQPHRCLPVPCTVSSARGTGTAALPGPTGRSCLAAPAWPGWRRRGAGDIPEEPDSRAGDAGNEEKGEKLQPRGSSRHGWGTSPVPAHPGGSKPQPAPRRRTHPQKVMLAAPGASRQREQLGTCRGCGEQALGSPFSPLAGGGGTRVPGG